jgi:hypothetical protein
MKLVAYPNPTTGSLYVNFSLSTKQTLSLDVIDIYGRVVGRKTIHANAGSNQTTISLTEAAAGLYVVRLQNDQCNETVTIIKQ